MPKRKDVGGSADPAAKKVKVQQKFRSEYADKYPCITRSNVSVNHAFCKTCKLDFSVAHAGMFDVQRHAASKGHIEKAKSCSNVMKIGTFFQADSQKENLDVIRA